ncbi:hypothetical protein [Kitasatospora sp. NPDC057198]|uniref:hypothetical protein n=1 Tax=Kitasatospora sp. NPDC057198 TaxID=3346046 RepID=UPI0036413C08
MSFRNPIRSLSADDVTPGTLTGSIVQTGDTDPRVVLDPSPDSSTGTEDPAILLYGNWASIPGARPGVLSASVAGQVGNVSAGEIVLNAPTAAGIGRTPPALRLYSEPVSNTTGALTGDGQRLELYLGGGTSHDGEVSINGYSGGIDAAASARLTLTARDASTAAGGTSTSLQLGSGVATVNRPLRHRSLFGVEGWHDVTFRSGWTNFDASGWQGVQARRNPDGTVSLRGLFKPTAGASGGTAFDLPYDGVTNYYPTGRAQIFPLACQSSVGACLFVYPDGHVDVSQASASTQWLSIGTATWDAS